MIDRLSYRKEAVHLARRLHIARPLKEAYFRLKVPPDRVLRSKVGGLEAKFYAPTAGEWRILSQLDHGGGERFIKALLSGVSAGQVFYDVGSNVGEYAVFIAMRVGPEGTVVAFEPVKSSYERIQDNIKVNAFTNVKTYRVALSDRAGLTKLMVGGFLSRQSHLVEQPAGTGHFETVEVITGDLLRQSQALPFPNAVKIDVEGHEYQVLQGMRETLSHPACTLLCCEVHPTRLPAPITPGEVAQIVRSFGFSLIETTTRGSEIHLVCRKEGSIGAKA